MTTQDDVYWCRVTLEVSTTDIDWLSSEFHDLLATKTTGVALAAVRSLEDTEINGIVGWQLLEGPSARPPAAEGFGPRRVGNAPCAGLEDHGTPAAVPSEESDKKEFQRGRKAKLHDDVEATALRQHDAQGDLGCGGLANAVPHSDIRDCRLQQAWQRVDVYVGAVCHPEGVRHQQRSHEHACSDRHQYHRPDPEWTCLSLSRSLSKRSSTDASNGQQCDCHKHEHDQDCIGDELHAVRDKGKCGWWKGKGKGGM